MKTTLDEMLVFIAIVDSGSITAAAEVLGQTISATSRTMSRLEEKLQTTLMRRTTRRLELTEEGKTYLEQARRIIASVEEAEELMNVRRNQPAGLLRVDAASPFMLHVIAALVPGYRKRYPQVELELNSNEGNIDLLERRTDLAIRIGRLKDSSLHAVSLGSSRVRVLASPGYLAEHGTPRRVADLAAHTLLGFSQLEALNEWPLQDADGQPLHVKPAVRCHSGETLRQLALNDGGIVCLSDFMTRGDRKAGTLQPLLAKQTLDVRQPINAVYYRNTAISSRIKSFIDYVVEAVGPDGFAE
ncbi:LysR substrate-binding domain-containing protein [Achromobacter deleyi]|uniref:LysR substrate-binding domain-containing protein n=1 Tax=Achromobacter deleyi TaxID=1353891 RepID=UPI0014924EAB|nr:LysR substrate-binding domain-containing protein [Achromobacter deleyi]QVQ25226.1 LysR family transcriptional regulator [Achromobacter deleyi]UIP20769.1 LysR substrate-binding domain-containing protein [Achromobacter deleyi]